MTRPSRRELETRLADLGTSDDRHRLACTNGDRDPSPEDTVHLLNGGETTLRELRESAGGHTLVDYFAQFGDAQPATLETHP